MRDDLGVKGAEILCRDGGGGDNGGEGFEEAGGRVDVAVGSVVGEQQGENMLAEGRYGGCRVQELQGCVHCQEGVLAMFSLGGGCLHVSDRGRGCLLWLRQQVENLEKRGFVFRATAGGDMVGKKVEEVGKFVLIYGESQYPSATWGDEPRHTDVNITA